MTLSTVHHDGSAPRTPSVLQLLESLDSASIEVFLAGLRRSLAPSFVFDIHTLQILCSTECCDAVLRYDADRLESMCLSELWPEDEREWRSDLVKMGAECPEPQSGTGLALNLICGDGFVLECDISFVDVPMEGRRLRLVLLKRSNLKH